jgi:raffinose/stachyose/melibiose transport system permease protein
MFEIRTLIFLSVCLTWVRATPPELSLDIPILVAGYGAEFFEETAREFEKLRPTVRVNIYGDPRINDHVRTRVMAGDWPDATDSVLLYSNLIQAGKLYDLSADLEGPNWENTGKWRDDFRPGVLTRWSVVNKTDSSAPFFVYGLPYAHAVWVFFYDKARFRREGWTVPGTWDEFFALCQLIEEKGGAALSLPGMSMRYGDAILRAAHYNLVGASGYTDYRNLVAGTRSDSRFIRAAEVLARVANEHLARGWEGMTHTAAQLEFIEGRCAMTLSASWFANEMRGRIPTGFELGAFNFPVFPDGISSRDTIQAQSGYYFLFRTGDPARERATVDFFRFMTSRSRVRRFVELTDAPVALRCARQADYSPRMMDTAAILESSRTSFDAAPVPSSAAQGTLQQEFTDARYQLMTGRIDARQFGLRLESAAQAERARAIDPGHVEQRHLTAALALGLVFLVCLAWLLKPLARVRRVECSGSSGSGFLDRGFGILFVGPAFALYAAFVLLPAVAAFALAFFRWDGFGTPEWVGLLNFRWLLLESDVFWSALTNNGFLMFVPPLLVVPVALALAAFIHRGGRGSAFIRVVLLFPNLLGGIAAALIWMAAYEPSSGFVNSAFCITGDIIAACHGPAAVVDWFHAFHGHAWLAQANLYGSLLPIYLWMAAGFNLVLYLAAMQGVPHELYEAAELDGASPVRQFFLITLPLIRGVLAVSAVFLVIGGLNAFELIWLLTGQEPAAATHTLGTFMVGMLFGEFQAGRSAAIAVVLFCLVLAGSLAVMRLMRTEEDEV